MARSKTARMALRRREEIGEVMARTEQSAPSRPAIPDAPKRWAAQAPALDTWLKRYAGTSSRLEDAELWLDGQLASGQGFADRDVLEYAYLALVAERKRPAEVIPFSSQTVTAKIEPVGMAEVCAMTGLKRMQVKRLRDRAAFPEPFAEVAATPLWNREEIELWQIRNS